MAGKITEYNTTLYKRYSFEFRSIFVDRTTVMMTNSTNVQIKPQRFLCTVVIFCKYFAAKVKIKISFQHKDRS